MAVKEVWKPVVGFQGKYEVSSIGRVRSLIQQPSKHREFMRTRTCKDGRLLVVIYGPPCKQHTRSVHRLVAEAFIGPRPVGKQVNHKNGDFLDNRAENLEYVTHLENVLHSWDVAKHCKAKGRRIAASARVIGEKNPSCKLTANQVEEIRSLLGTVRRKVLAERFGVCRQTIDGICNGARWKSS